MVSTEGFDSDLPITLIHSFKFLLIQWICKFCLIYHLLFLLVLMRFNSSFLVHVRFS